MGFLKRGSAKRKPPGPWMPTSRDTPMSAEQEQIKDGDDLAELLAATNAKRLARGKRALSVDDVQMRVWSEEQGRRRSVGQD